MMPLSLSRSVAAFLAARRQQGQVSKPDFLWRYPGLFDYGSETLPKVPSGDGLPCLWSTVFTVIAPSWLTNEGGVPSFRVFERYVSELGART